MKKIYSILMFSFSLTSFSQNYQAGNTYFGTDSLIEYRCGNLPLVLSAPHGGYEIPTTIPDRNCSGCVTGRDSYTQELTRELSNALFVKTGCYPHVIINKLHRKKLDANREIIEATDSNPATEIYWNEYMDFCDSAKNRVSKNYKKGLFLDIHGHGHTIQRVELGYRLTGANLRNSDSVLNTNFYQNYVSIAHLVDSNINSYSNSDLLRGEHSFGSMLYRKGIPAVPSDSIPFPLASESFFGGGYNTVRFGSSNGGTIDAIQIESHQTIRFNSADRLAYADSLAEIIVEYLEQHYFTNFSQIYCHTASLNQAQSNNWKVFPNPTANAITVTGFTESISYQLFTLQGVLIQRNEILNHEKINLSGLTSGIYLLRLNNKKTSQILKIIKK